MSKSKLITLVLDEELLERLDELAQKLNISRSELIRTAIRLYVAGKLKAVISYPAFCLNCKRVTVPLWDGRVLRCEKYFIILRRYGVPRTEKDVKWYFIVRCSLCGTEGILRYDGKLEPVEQAKKDFLKFSDRVVIEYWGSLNEKQVLVRWDNVVL